MGSSAALRDFMAKPTPWIGAPATSIGSVGDGGTALFSGGRRIPSSISPGLVAKRRRVRGVPRAEHNSYKRYAAGSWAPTTLAWGYDNRTCGLPGRGPRQSLRVECRIPGAMPIRTSPLRRCWPRDWTASRTLNHTVSPATLRVRRQALSAHAHEQSARSNARHRSLRRAFGGRPSSDHY